MSEAIFVALENGVVVAAATREAAHRYPEDILDWMEQGYQVQYITSGTVILGQPLEQPTA